MQERIQPPFVFWVDLFLLIEIKTGTLGIIQIKFQQLLVVVHLKRKLSFQKKNSMKTFF